MDCETTTLELEGSSHLHLWFSSYAYDGCEPRFLHYALSSSSRWLLLELAARSGLEAISHWWRRPDSDNQECTRGTHQ
jgi:hypothetical protein